MIYEVFNQSIRISKSLGEAFKNVISNDETRKFLCYVYYDQEQKRLVGTDGRQLLTYDVHECFISCLPDEGAYYTITKGKDFSYLVPVEKQADYPSARRILENDRYDYKAGNTFSITRRKDKNAEAFYYMQQAVETAINFYTAEKVLKNLTEFNIAYSQNGETRMLRCYSENWEYVLQGMYLYD